MDLIGVLASLVSHSQTCQPQSDLSDLSDLSDSSDKKLVDLLTR